jgi:hypothetical protein
VQVGVDGGLIFICLGTTVIKSGEFAATLPGEALARVNVQVAAFLLQAGLASVVNWVSGSLFED